jgi:hypothetical protein
MLRRPRDKNGLLRPAYLKSLPPEQQETHDMPSRYEDGFRQAQRDISHAQHALEDGDYDWACFAAQQAAQKAVKALLRFLTADAWGQSVSLLLRRLPETYGAENYASESTVFKASVL